MSGDVFAKMMQWIADFITKIVNMLKALPTLFESETADAETTTQE